MIRVLAADHHPLYREGLARLVRQSSQLELVGEVGEGKQVSAAVKAAEPDVALVEPEMLGPDPRPALGRLARLTHVVLVAGGRRPADPYQALGAGASGYLSKFATSEQLTDAIERVARGETVLAPEMVRDVAADIRLREASKGPPLSHREMQVLEFLADGLSVRAMAEQLYVGVATIRTHKLNLYEKLGVRDRGAAVAEGYRRGLLD